MQTIRCVVFDEEFQKVPNHFAISLACIAGFAVVSIAVSLNVVEIGLSVMEFIPWPS